MSAFAFPDGFDQAISTRGLSHGRLRARASTAVPSAWVGEIMETNGQKLLHECLTVLVTGAGFAGGALLCNHIVPGFASMAFGTIAGAASAFVAFQAVRVRVLSVGGSMVQVKAELEQAVKDAGDARRLAQLAVETTMMLANRSYGALGGPRVGQNDSLRKLIGDRLLEMGFTKKEGSHFARFDEPAVAQRIIGHLIINAVSRSAAGGREKAESLIPSLLSGVAPTPSVIERLLGPDLMADQHVLAAWRFYRDWHASDARLYFTIENMDRLKDSANKSNIDIL